MNKAPDTHKHFIAGLLLIVLAATVRWQINVHHPSAAASKSEMAANEWEGWHPATEQERQGAIKSISSQLNAFKQDNFEKAALYQSQGLKMNFPSVDSFRKMMKSMYPQFVRYKSVDFGPARSDENGERVEISVRLMGEDGVQTRALYQMVLEGEVYRVAGVRGGARPHVAPELPPGLDA